MHLDPSYKIDLGFSDCFGRTELRLITEEIWYIIVLLTCCKISGTIGHLTHNGEKSMEVIVKN